MANYKNKETAAGEGHPSSLGKSAAAPPTNNKTDDQTQQEQPTMKKKKGIYTPQKETSLSGEKVKKILLQKGIQPTKSGKIKFPDGTTQIFKMSFTIMKKNLKKSGSYTPPPEQSDWSWHF